jgi:hypothetical protein
MKWSLTANHQHTSHGQGDETPTYERDHARSLELHQSTNYHQPAPHVLSRSREEKLTTINLSTSDGITEKIGPDIGISICVSISFGESHRAKLEVK